jgi:hypothetical protein
MLRRNDCVLLAVVHDLLLCTVVQRGLRPRLHELLRAYLHRGLRASLHKLLFGRIFELLRTSRVHHELRRRLVSWLLGRSSSHTFVGLADGLRRRIPDKLCSGLRTERLLIVPVWLCDQLCSSLLELFKLFIVCIAVQHVRFVRTVQLVFVLHRRLCSVMPVRFILRLQLV